jgi:hypothetical protein
LQHFTANKRKWQFPIFKASLKRHSLLRGLACLFVLSYIFTTTPFSHGKSAFQSINKMTVAASTSPHGRRPCGFPPRFCRTDFAAQIVERQFVLADDGGYGVLMFRGVYNFGG